MRFVGGILVGALVAGLMLWQAPRTTTPPAERVAAPPELPLELVRSVVRAEIRAAVAAQPRLEPAAAVATAVPAVASQAAAPTHEQAAALSRGQTVVDSARQARRWTPDDAQKLRELLPQLTAEQRDELMADLMPALNSGLISLETQGPPI